jgi:hypothetical protein
VEIRIVYKILVRKPGRDHLVGRQAGISVGQRIILKWILKKCFVYYIELAEVNVWWVSVNT